MRIQLSLQHRLIMAFLGMSLLVLFASGAGFYFTRSVDEAIDATKEGFIQIQAINDLQSDWRKVTELVGVLFLTRQIDRTSKGLDRQFAAFDSQLSRWENNPPGIQTNTIAANQSIVNNLRMDLSAMRSTLEEIMRLAGEGRWAVARDMRETVLVQQQTEFNIGLQMLMANIRDDVQASFLESERTQNFTRSISIAAAIAALVAAVVLGMGATRSIVIPVNQLTEATQRVTLGDFNTVKPLSRSDEIGNLSRSFALMTEWLQDSHELLENRVAQRTKELEHQNLQIQAAAEIARDISGTRNPQGLLDHAVELVGQRFGYYHTGIFLLDDAIQFAVLRAAYGPASAEMLSRLHKLKVGEVGIVGHVALSGEPRIALEVDLDRTYYQNPFLPETRSEIAIPMKVGNRVIGVLDAQSQYEETFRESDLDVLQILADLLAVAIHNAQLNQEIEENLNELETLYGMYSREAWQNADQSLEFQGYQYDRTGVHPIEVRQPNGGEGVNNASPTESIPIIIRNQQIGTLNVWPGEKGFHPDDITLLNDVVVRISQSMESARLFYESQRRADNERVVRKASTHMRETLDVESVLRTAAEDFYHTLKLSQISIDLSPPGHTQELDGKADAARWP